MVGRASPRPHWTSVTLWSFQAPPGAGSSGTNRGDSCSSTSKHRHRPEPIAPKRAPGDGVDLDQIDIVAHDMAATLAFYRGLGVQIPDEAIWRTPTGIHHVNFTMPSGLIIHFDSPQLAAAYNTGWQEPDGTRDTCSASRLPNVNDV